MGKQKIRRPASGTLSGGGGKFYFELEYTLTASKFVVTPKIIITEAFNKKQTFKYNIPGIVDGGSWQKAKGTYSPISVNGKPNFQSLGKITMSCAGKTVTIAAGTIAITDVNPAAPSRIVATKVSDALFRIAVEGADKLTAPTNRVEIQRCKDIYDTNQFQDIPSNPFSVTSDANTHEWYIEADDGSDEVERGHAYWYRARTYNSTANKYSSWIYTGPVYTSSNNDSITTGLTATRISNTEIQVEWGISSVSYVQRNLVTAFEVYRKTDGSAPAKMGTVHADTEHTQYSFTDDPIGNGRRQTWMTGYGVEHAGPTADHVYTYLLKVVGAATADDTETYTEESEPVYMTPCKPQKIEVAHNSSGDVVVTVTNKSHTATGVCFERSIDGGAWVFLAEEEYVEGGQTYLDEAVVAENTIEYRVRNHCEQMTGTDAYSEYLSSAAVIEKTPPNPPTLKTPVSGSNIVLDQGTVRMVWQHNALDGSSQEEAVLQIKANDGAWTSYNKTDESYHNLDISTGYSANDVITWRVKTRGACTEGDDNGFSAWSEESTFSIITRPQIRFTAPLSGAMITTLPLEMAWEYDDLCGNLQSLSVDILKRGVLEKTFDVPISDPTLTTYSYSLAGFLFENDTVYGLTVRALSTSGFTATADISITVAYEEATFPDGTSGLIPVVSFDEDAIAYIVAERDMTPDPETGETPELADIAEAYLYRLHDRERTLVASGIKEGDQVIDKYAPINTVFAYELLMLTQEGQVALIRSNLVQESQFWYVYWNDNIARAEWNPEGQINLKRPEKTQVRYSGRRYPVTYDSDALEETFSFSTVIIDRDELDNFRQMIRDGGQGIWKSADGDVYDASFEFAYQSEYYNSSLQWECSLSVTRIDGDI